MCTKNRISKLWSRLGMPNDLILNDVEEELYTPAPFRPVACLVESALTVVGDVVLSPGNYNAGALTRGRGYRDV